MITPERAAQILETTTEKQCRLVMTDGFRVCALGALHKAEGAKIQRDLGTGKYVLFYSGERATGVPILMDTVLIEYIVYWNDTEKLTFPEISGRIRQYQLEGGPRS